MVFYAKKENGLFNFYDQKGWGEHLLKLKNGEYVIEIKRKTKNRTLKQNAFYWLYLGIIAMETGDNENDLHEYFKRALLPPRFKTILGKEVKLPATTTKLEPDEFITYMEKICALTQIPIPTDF